MLKLNFQASVVEKYCSLKTKQYMANSLFMVAINSASINYKVHMLPKMWILLECGDKSGTILRLLFISPVTPCLAKERLDFADNAPSRKAAALLSPKFNITLAV